MLAARFVRVDGFDCVLGRVIGTPLAFNRVSSVKSSCAALSIILISRANARATSAISCVRVRIEG